MDCCQCEGIEAVFDRRTADRELRQYRKDGPARTTRMLIDALKAEGIEGLTLLDIGGGIGVIQHELLEAGVASATIVDAATAYIEVSKQEAERQGHADRVSYHQGDLVALAPDVRAADVVTLDRVICCYHDVRSLVGLSSERARKLYGLVYPQDTWLVRLWLATVNLISWLSRSKFRSFLHPPVMVDAIVRSNGLRQRYYRKSFPWEVVIYGR